MSLIDLYLYYRLFFLLLLWRNGSDIPLAAYLEPPCTEPYACLTTKECAEIHSGAPIQEVLFHCARKTKVCCPPFRNPQNTTRGSSKVPSSNVLTSHRNVHLLPNSTECGIGNYINKITEGDEALLAEFPWMALLGFKDSTGGFHWNCGGTLISDRYVLTAAHCVIINNQTVKYVRLGEHNLLNDTDCNKDTCLDPPEDISIERAIIHQKWNATTIKNDIALLRLSRSALQSGKTSIVPICLPLNIEALNITDDTKYEVAGWGKTEWNSRYGSDVLRKAFISGVSKEECNICKDKKQEQYCPITDDEICVQGWKGVDVCKGDSGGPLMDFSKINVVQIGITSFKGSEHCGGENIPSIFTRVSSFMPWILDNISN